MKYFLSVLMFTIAVSTNSFGQIPKPADANAGVERELRALLQTEYTAGMHNDIATINRIWADEYVSTGPKGQTTTKAQMLSYYKTAPLSDTRVGPMAINDVQVNVYGDVAVMTGRATGTLQNGKPAGASLRFTRVHVKRQGQWIVVANHLSRIEAEPKRKP
ncbi:MAG: nuclear transport factor 2 family protein [Pyrinomonadaceae bacterium]